MVSRSNGSHCPRRSAPDNARTTAWIGAAMQGRSGRDWGELRGDLVEVRNLAQWLREQIDGSGKTLRDLQEQLPYGRTKISESLNGARRPDFAFVRAVIECVVVQDLRAARLHQARTLWSQADPARAHRIQTPVQQRTEPGGEAALARERELSDQLHAALSSCAALERSLGQSRTLILMLNAMMTKLRGQVEELTAEREQLLANQAPFGSAAGQVEQQLEQAREQQERAAEALARAVAERDEARHLQSLAEDQAARLAAELAELRAAPRETTVQSARAPAVVPITPLRGDIDAALEKAADILDAQAAEHARIADALAEDQPGNSGDTPKLTTVVGEVVGQSTLSAVATSIDRSPTADKPGPFNIAHRLLRPLRAKPHAYHSIDSTRATLLKRVESLDNYKRSSQRRIEIRKLCALAEDTWRRWGPGERVALTDAMLRACVARFTSDEFVLAAATLGACGVPQLADTLLLFFARDATAEMIIAACSNTGLDETQHSNLLECIARERPELLESLTTLDPRSFETLMHARQEVLSPTNGKAAGWGMPRHVLTWPPPAEEMLLALQKRGFTAHAWPTDGIVPATELPASLFVGSERPTVLLIDPVVSPVNRRGLRIAHTVANETHLPVLITAGIHPDKTDPDPWQLVEALLTQGRSDALIIEGRANFGRALASGLTRRGISSTVATSDQKALLSAETRFPDVVIANFSAIRQRRSGVIKWVRSHPHPATHNVVPVILYTAPGPDLATSRSQQLGLRARDLHADINESILRVTSILSRA